MHHGGGWNGPQHGQWAGGGGPGWGGMLPHEQAEVMVVEGEARVRRRLASRSLLSFPALLSGRIPKLLLGPPLISCRRVALSADEGPRGRTAFFLQAWR